ncbi:hypothetical protein PS6_009077 [Mucor atramentarius]
MNETEVLPSSNNISHLYKSEGGCGEASLSCMAFGYKSSIPIRCGILKNAPLCERLDPISKPVEGFAKRPFHRAVWVVSMDAPPPDQGTSNYTRRSKHLYGET